jgi:hypothetical protein
MGGDFYLMILSNTATGIELYPRKIASDPHRATPSSNGA